MDVPYLSPNKLQSAAHEFLATDHCESSIPVPIEEIIEFELGMDIVPVPGLHRARHIDGFITSDLSAIYVDDWLQTERGNRYRFTLAHEVAHDALDKPRFTDNQFTSISQCKEFVESLDDNVNSRLEFHANGFAGFALTPPSQLKRMFDELITEIPEERRSDFSSEEPGKHLHDTTSDFLG